MTISHKLIYLVIFLSSIGGISYEILYSRVISVFAGDLSYIIATVLFSLFLGLSFGYKCSYLIKNNLWVVEFCLAIYAFMIAYLFFNHISSILDSYSSFFINPSFSIFISFLFIFIPMFLTGFTIPVISKYLDLIENKENNFIKVYGLYSLGVAIFILFIEYLFIKNLGISKTLVFAGFCNLFAAGILLYIKYFKNLRLDLNFSNKFKFSLFLFIFGFLSSIFQFLLISILFDIFFSSIEIFSIMLSSILAGIFIASKIGEKYKINPKNYIKYAGIVVVIPFVFLTQVIYLYLYLVSIFNFSLLMLFVIKILLIFFISLPAFTIFGLSVPVAIKYFEDEEEKDLLFSNAIGNAFGIVIAFFFLYNVFDIFSYLIFLLLLSLIIYYIWK